MFKDESCYHGDDRWEFYEKSSSFLRNDMFSNLARVVQV